MSQQNRTKVPVAVDYPHIRKTLAVVSGKWRVIVILLLGEHTLRFGQIRDQLPAISEKMLAGELKALVILDVLSRNVHAEIPSRVEYTLTKKGLMALPILRQLLRVGQLFS